MSEEPAEHQINDTTEPEEDETEVVPHSEDTEEQLPWCVGCMG